MIPLAADSRFKIKSLTQLFLHYGTLDLLTFLSPQKQYWSLLEASQKRRTKLFPLAKSSFMFRTIKANLAKLLFLKLQPPPSNLLSTFVRNLSTFSFLPVLMRTSSSTHTLVTSLLIKHNPTF